MSGDTTHLRALLLVAAEADVGLRRLAQHLLIRRMNVVAVGARHATTLVLTAGPVRSRKHLRLMAREACGTPLLGIRNGLGLGSKHDVGRRRWSLDVVFAGSVTVSTRGRPRIALVAVTSLEDGDCRFRGTRAVAGHALCVISESALRRCRLSRTCCGYFPDCGGRKRKAAAECEHAHAYDSSLHQCPLALSSDASLRRCRRPIATDMPSSLPTEVVSGQWVARWRNPYADFLRQERCGFLPRLREIPATRNVRKRKYQGTASKPSPSELIYVRTLSLDYRAPRLVDGGRPVTASQCTPASWTIAVTSLWRT